MRTVNRIIAVAALLLVFIPISAVADSPTSTAVTIYNQNLALIRQVRTINLEKGVQEYSYDGVAAQIDPTSVHFNAGGVSVMEQNYEYDLVDYQTLLRKFIGETVTVYLADSEVTGRLLAEQQQLILEMSGGRVKTLNADEIVSVDFPRLPEGLVLKPTLKWELLSERKGKVEGELSYLTRGISWEASYVAVVSRNDDALDFSGWVQIDNRSGATYENARLKLMAGDVRIEQEFDGRRRTRSTMMELDKTGGGFEEKSFFEYHLYTLPRPATIRDRQTKQLTLFPAATTAAKKVLTYDPQVDQKKVEVAIEFVNSEKNGLGIALPKGKVRLMKRDSDGSLEFIGEDRIDHTPKNETVRLRTGNAFDIVVERKKTDQQVGEKWREMEYEVEIRNSKDKPVEIIVVEHLSANWKIVKENIVGAKKDAVTYEWVVTVPAEGAQTLNYRYKIWW